MASIADWLDDRTGYRKLVAGALDEEVVGGARWAYVFGSGLLAIFSFQVLTGLLLMATYTPSVTGAWASVFYIQHKIAGGWFVRGLHAYGAQAMVVVLGMHLLQVAIYGAYKKPREVTWWFGLALLGVVQGLALTGYLLPWDQKGYWATKVATNIAGTLPVIGSAAQTLIVGGSEYGQSTLTRFYVLHVGVLPATLVLLAVMHLYLFRRNGATPPPSADLTKVEPFYPHQVAKDMGFAVLVLAVIAILTSISHGGHLDAPADPSADYPPRPEWYFLFLFELLKYLPGSMELVGTVVLPGLAMGFLFALPFLDKGDSKRVGDRLPWIAPLLVGGVGVVVLTAMSLNADAKDQEFQAARAEAHVRAERAVELAKAGIPAGGPLAMLANDPMSRGADLYAQHCQSCHLLNGQGERAAPDHDGFGSRKWILGMLHEPQADKYFGETEIDEMKSMDELGDAALTAVTEFLYAEGQDSGDTDFDKALVSKGKAVFEDKCMDCHLYGEEGADIFDGPNLQGYASLAWIRAQIANPDAESQYGELNEMPAFGEDLNEHDIDMIARFLRTQRGAKPAPSTASAAQAKAD